VKIGYFQFWANLSNFQCQNKIDPFIKRVGSRVNPFPALFKITAAFSYSYGS